MVTKHCKYQYFWQFLEQKSLPHEGPFWRFFGFMVHRLMGNGFIVSHFERFDHIFLLVKDFVWSWSHRRLVHNVHTRVGFKIYWIFFGLNHRFKDFGFNVYRLLGFHIKYFWGFRFIVSSCFFRFLSVMIVWFSFAYIYITIVPLLLNLLLEFFSRFTTFGFKDARW